MDAVGAIAQQVDVLIVGAGISGIGMAARLAERCPGKRFLMLDRREQLGGTWDLFRYPGIRSDSDMHTFAFEFAPWLEAETIGSGEQIRAYLHRVVGQYGLGEHMRFGLQVTAADWDGGAGLWRVSARQADGTTRLFACRFLFMGSGYYDYDDPHDAAIPGLEAFKGTTIHPQFWPENFDYGGKNVVIVGSGATAVTVVPAMAASAAHVTMLQRTPTWYAIQPSRDPVTAQLRRWLPGKWAWKLGRAKAMRLHELVFRRARTEPEAVGALLKGMVRKHLGPAWSEADYSPPYKPWEQRLCLVPDGDMFAAIREGRASVVTGEIAQVVGDGIALKDGRRLEADVIVTATGLRLAALGKVRLSVDGRPIDVSQHFWYRDCMLSNVPNFAALFGYLNASWTLRVDVVSDWLCRLFNQMDHWNMQVATPLLPQDHALVEDYPFDLFSSGWLQRGKHLIPRSSTQAPWRIHMHHRQDKAELATAPIDDGWMQFERTAALAPAD